LEVINELHPGLGAERKTQLILIALLKRFNVV